LVTAHRTTTLAVSIHIWGAADAPPGKARRQRLRDDASLGLSRAIVQGFAGTRGTDKLEPLVEHAAAAGLLGTTVSA
jgi:hypothetical protein